MRLTVVDEGVEDGHRLVGDTSIGVDLLEDLVDVGGVGLLADPLALLLLAVSASGGRGGLLASGSLLSGLSLSGLGWGLRESVSGLVMALGNLFLPCQRWRRACQLWMRVPLELSEKGG